MYPRFAENRIREALSDTPVVVVNGPRQSGKTTLVRKLAGKERAYFTLDDPTLLAAARRDPVGFVRGLDRAVIDEVQRAPDLLLAVKRSVDDDRRPGRFLLTGSAHVLTVPTVADSLAGRMEVVSLYPLSRGEIIGRCPTFLARAFAGHVPAPAETLDGDALIAMAFVGGYPEVLARPSDRRRRDWCRSYIRAVIERDVREIAGVEKLKQMPRLLETLAQLSGRLTNFTEIGGQLNLDRKTVDRYVGVLEQLFLVQRLQPWFRNELKRLIKTPKLHFLDAGLLTALRDESVKRLHVDRAPLGAILESFVYAELLKQVSWSEERVLLYHYRDKDQVEVDFVLEDEAKGIVGIEVKAAATVKLSDFQGLERLSRACGKAFKLGIVLYDGDKVVSFGARQLAAPFPCLWG